MPRSTSTLTSGLADSRLRWLCHALCDVRGVSGLGSRGGGSTPSAPPRGTCGNKGHGRSETVPRKACYKGARGGVWGIGILEGSHPSLDAKRGSLC